MSNERAGSYTQDVLAAATLPFKHIIGSEIFQQDNTAQQIVLFLTENNINLFPWSARSLDLLSIEYIQNIIGWRLLRSTNRESHYETKLMQCARKYSITH